MSMLGTSKDLDQHNNPYLRDLSAEFSLYWSA